MSDLTERIKQLAGSWTSISALGRLALYVLGYLMLRFHLTALGVGIDLAVLDERYLFAGAKFLVYLVTSIPIVILLLLSAAALVYFPCCLLPLSIRASVRASTAGHRQRIAAWWSDPKRLGLTGIVFSVAMIQFVMRQCLFFNNLLLAPGLPDPRWLRDLLLDKIGGLMSLYFAGLVASSFVTLWFFLSLRKKDIRDGFSQFLRSLLGFLAAVQFLLLPVNYGILVTDKVMPRVEGLGERRLSATETV